MSKIKTIKITKDATPSNCRSGFLRLERLLVKTVFENGEETEPYPCDIWTRKNVDAVAVLPWYEKDGRKHVILKSGVRPAVYLRSRKNVPMPTEEPPVLLEAIAGMLEEQDKGEEAVARRACSEAQEECGVAVPAENVEILGGMYPTPGCSDEKIHLCLVKLDSKPPLKDGGGDGSLMEIGTQRIDMSHQKALDMCMSGQIKDMKTEILLHRLNYGS